MNPDKLALAIVTFVPGVILSTVVPLLYLADIFYANTHTIYYQIPIYGSVVLGLALIAMGAWEWGNRQ
jgi:hypothetical protein